MKPKITKAQRIAELERKLREALAEEFYTTQLKAIEHLNTLDLANALWWFIENIDADHKDRSDIFFYLRERVRTELK